jgi:threonine/homoserine efflux transporter RhtA
MFEGVGFKTLAFITGFFESAGYLLNAFIFIPYLGDVFAMNYNGVSYTVGAIICLAVYIIKRKKIYHNNENPA